MTDPEVKKIYLKSAQLPPLTQAQMVGYGFLGLILTPIYWLLAYMKGVPGTGFRWKCLWFGLRLLLRRHAGRADLKRIMLLILFPLDSTRYFELDFVWRALAESSPGKFLDVSSPRVFFTLLLQHHSKLSADLINPDKADLAETEALIRIGGWMPRCRLHNCLIADAPFAPASFDTITSISVVEHIPDDREAIRKMWEILKPGGRLLLTVPCVPKKLEEYIDQDEYGLYGAGGDGQIFWARYYDEPLLQHRILSITGPPRRQQIFAERSAGLFLKNATQKRTNRWYPFWREPWMVAQEYKYFSSFAELPGEGVIAMEFVKS